MFKYFLPYDVFERHKKVGSFIKKNQSVVDVGGEMNHLLQFCSPKKIIVANLTSGDVIISREKLPFTVNSFDVACSIDVLEHIPKYKRKKFINNLLRVASKRVILSFPIGTKEHIYYEKELHRFLEEERKSISYLDEHLLYGLPKKEDLADLTHGYNRKIIYSGNIKLNGLLFKLLIFDPQVKYLRKIIYFLKILFNLLTNEIIYLLLSNKKYSQSVNRAYVIIDK